MADTLDPFGDVNAFQTRNYTTPRPGGAAPADQTEEADPFAELKALGGEKPDEDQPQEDGPTANDPITDTEISPKMADLVQGTVRKAQADKARSKDRAITQSLAGHYKDLADKWHSQATVYDNDPDDWARAWKSTYASDNRDRARSAADALIRSLNDDSVNPNVDQMSRFDMIAESGRRGLVEGLVDAKQGAGIASGTTKFQDLPSIAPPGEDTVSQLLTKPFSEGWSDPMWLASHIVYGTAKSSPTLAGGFAGTYAGGQVGGAPGAVAGGMAGMTAGAALQTIGPAYLRARSQGLDHDPAVDQAMRETGIVSAFTAAMGWIPGVSIFGKTVSTDAAGAVTTQFKKPISEALAQIFAVQPALMAGQQVATGLNAGHLPSAEELAEGYVTGVGSGAIITGVHRGAQAAFGKGAEPTQPSPGESQGQAGTPEATPSAPQSGDAVPASNAGPESAVPERAQLEQELTSLATDRSEAGQARAIELRQKLAEAEPLVEADAAVPEADMGIPTSEQPDVNRQIADHISDAFGIEHPELRDALHQEVAKADEAITAERNAELDRIADENMPGFHADMEQAFSDSGIPFALNDEDVRLIARNMASGQHAEEAISQYATEAYQAEKARREVEAQATAEGRPAAGSEDPAVRPADGVYESAGAPAGGVRPEAMGGERAGPGGAGETGRASSVAREAGEASAANRTPTNAHRTRFQDSLASGKSAQKALEESGATGEAAHALIDEGIESGTLRIDSKGKVRKTARAKIVGKAEPETLPEAMAHTAAIEQGLRISPTVRIERMVQRYEAEAGRVVDPKVLDLAERLEGARGNPEAFSEIADTLKPLLSKQEALDLANLVGLPTNTKTTKAEAIQSIVDRHEEAVLDDMPLASIRSVLSNFWGGSRRGPYSSPEPREEQPKLSDQQGKGFVEVYHAAPIAVADNQFRPQSRMGSDPGIFFTTHPAISGPEGAWTLGTVNEHGSAVVHEVRINIDASRVPDLSLPLEKQPPEFQEQFLRNAPFVAKIQNHPGQTIGGKKPERLDPGYLARQFLDASGGNRAEALASLAHRKGDYGRGTFRQTKAVLETGAEPSYDVFSPDVPIFSQFKQRDFDKFGFPVITWGNGEEVVVYDRKLISVTKRTKITAPQESAEHGIPLASIARLAPRDLDNLGFYSKLDEVLSTLRPTDIVTADTLQKKGVKQAELQARGVGDLLSDGKGAKVSELAEIAGKNPVEVKEVKYPNPSPAEKERLERIEVLQAEQQDLIARQSSTMLGRVNPSLARRIDENHRELFDLLNASNRGEGDAKWRQYSLDPSNPTYRETVLHLPSKTEQGLEIPNTAGGWGNTDPNGPTMRNPEYDRVNFTSGHWSEPNVIAHARTQILTDAQGRKVFNIDELQSDWGQKLRDGGARDEAKIADITKRKASADEEYNRVTNDAKQAMDRLNPEKELGLEPFDYKWRAPDSEVVEARIERILEYYHKLERRGESDKLGEAVGIVGDVQELADRLKRAYEPSKLLDAELRTAEAATPGHPLVNTTDQWTSTALKRLIAQAVESGADAISLTPGKVHAERFSLSKQVDGLRYNEAANQVAFKRHNSGQWQYESLGNGKSLEDFVGKEYADRLRNAPPSQDQAHAEAGWKEIPDLGSVSIGGEGMKATYDSMYPRTLGKLLQKMDPAAKPETRELHTSGGNKILADGGKSIFGGGKGEQFTTFPITDKIREAVKTEGQALFAKGSAIDHFKDIAKALKDGETYEVPSHVIGTVQQAQAPLLKAVPSGTRVGTLESVKPHPKDPDRAVYIFRTTDGDTVSIPGGHHAFNGMRAMYLSGRSFKSGRPAILSFRFNELAPTLGSFDRGVAGELGHEISHGLIADKVLGGADLDRLVSHANALNVLDSQLGTHLEMIGDPRASHAGDATLREEYTGLYHSRPNFQNLMDGEAVAHLVENYIHFKSDPNVSAYGEADFAPVRDVLDRIVNGDYVRQPEPAMASLASIGEGSEPPKLRPEVLPHLPEVAKSLEAYLSRMLPKDAALRVVDQITHPITGDDLHGAYHPLRKLLEVALDVRDPGRAFATGRHEVIHALRMLKLFKDHEWQLLLERANKIGIGDQITALDASGREVPALSEYAKMYSKAYLRQGVDPAKIPGLIRELLDQERVAKMAEQYFTNKAKYGSRIDKLFDRVQNFFEAIRNAFRGLGFQTADDVFENVTSGKVGRRGNPSKAGNGPDLASVKTINAPLGKTSEPDVKSAVESLHDSLGLLVPRPIATPAREPDLRQQVLNVASEGGEKVLQKYGRDLAPVLNAHMDELKGYAGRSPDVMGDGFINFFRDFVAWPRDAEERAPKLESALRDFLDAKDPGLLEQIDKVQDSSWKTDEAGSNSPPPPPVQPPGNGSNGSGPSRFGALFQSLADKFDLGNVLNDIQLKTVPMAAHSASIESRAVAKDFANEMRLSKYQWAKADEKLVDEFTPGQLEKMWIAADEESVARQQGKDTSKIGISRLSPKQREAVEAYQPIAKATWEQLKAVGSVEGEGLPYWTPRMFIRVASGEETPRSLGAIGKNLKTTTSSMKHRKHLLASDSEAAAAAKLGDHVELVRNFRAMPLAIAKAQEAIAGRALINKIKEIGKQTTEPTVVEGAEPADSPYKWFHIDHPAFKTWRPKKSDTPDANGAYPVVKDENGETVMERVPLYVRSDFEGPLKAVLSQETGAIYRGMMNLKGKTMSVIMYSPLIHNAVEFGRAFPAMPGKVLTFRVYFEGNKAKNDPVIMKEAVQNGLVPIGHRAFNQDITGMMEEPSMQPGRSLTAKALGKVVRPFEPVSKPLFKGIGKVTDVVTKPAGAMISWLPGAKALGDAIANTGDFVGRFGSEKGTRENIDTMGDVWHNTLLWDRVGDLQMGLYTNFLDKLLAKGVDRQTASRTAAHFANRYAGALPNESMSVMARKVANLVMFSRSFTLGNIGAMKDALGKDTSLPKDVQAQIIRDAGADGLKNVSSVAKRKALAILALDLGLMYVMNSTLQDFSNKIRGEKTWGEIGHDYIERFFALMHRYGEHPFEVLNPFGALEKLSATSENEPGLEDRILIGYQKDGTAIYARNPVGKIGEEFKGYLTSPIDMIRKKQSTVARPFFDILSNDKGFGRKIYDPTADSPGAWLENLGRIGAYIVGEQLPMDSIHAAADLIAGRGDPTTSKLKVFGPLAGVTFRKGAPGGPALGELYRSEDKYNFRKNEALPEIRKLIQNGQKAEARKMMDDIGIPKGLQRYYEKTTINPSKKLSQRKVKDFLGRATQEEKDRYFNALRRQSEAAQSP